MTVRRSIQQKIAAAMLIVGLLPGFFGVFFTYQLGMRSLKSSIGANLQTIAVEAAEKINIIIGREIHNTRSLAISPLIIAAVKGNHGDAAMQGYIEKSLKQGDEKSISITIADNNGGLIAAAGKPLSIQSLHGPSRRKGGVFVGDINFDQSAHNYSILIVAPITDDKTGDALGDIAVLYNIKEIFGAINNIKVGMTGHANLVSSDGTLLICPLFPPQSHTINSDLLRQIAHTQSGWGIAADDAHGGKNSIIGFAPVMSTFQMGGENFGGKRWYVFIRQLPDETYAPIYALLWKVSAIGAALVGLLSLLGYFLAKRIVMPIKLLSEGAKLIGQGQLNHSLKIRTGDEIEELAGIFNQMAQNLEKRFQEILLERDKLDKDITERKRLEQRLLHSERVAALSRFSSTFAHDLRNPIIAVKKTLEMLKNSHTEDTNTKKVYEDLISTCGLLLGLVNDVLDIHQVSYKDLPLFYSSFSLSQALEDAVRLLKIEAEERGIHVEMEGGRDIHIEGDKRRMERVFINLLSNAIRHSPPGGMVKASFETSIDANNLIIKIEDEGPGIETEDLSKIFDLFYGKERSGIKSGTGLGLYFCKAVVGAHCGRIWAENRDKGGAVFYIEMPLLKRETDVNQDSHSR